MDSFKQKDTSTRPYTTTPSMHILASRSGEPKVNALEMCVIS